MSKPFDFFQYKKGVLSCEGVSLTQIARKVGTPAYIYSSEALLQPLKEFKKGLAGLDSLICFAVKSNSNVQILQLLAKNGAGMDVVSGGELFRVGMAKVPGDKIVFSGVGKTDEEIAEALQYRSKGIFSFNVESIDELTVINRIALEMKKKAQVALRFNPDVNPKTHPYISTGLKKNKFGLARSEVLKVVHNPDQYKGIQIQGLSIHIGSQLLSLAPIEEAFDIAGSMVEQINSILPSPLRFLDLGGGIGITYSDEKSPSIESYCQLLKKKFGKKRTDHPPLKILIEPGRVISGNSGALVTRVLYRKKRTSNDFLIIDAAMNDLIRPALYSSYHDIVPVDQPQRSTPLRKVSIVGPVCESADCFGKDRALPESLSHGDLLGILSAGAYGFTMASNYNSRPRPVEVLVQNGKFKVIRKRETYQDLILGE